MFYRCFGLKLWGGGWIPQSRRKFSCGSLSVSNAKSKSFHRYSLRVFFYNGIPEIIEYLLRENHCVQLVFFNFFPFFLSVRHKTCYNNLCYPSSRITGFTPKNNACHSRGPEWKKNHIVLTRKKKSNICHITFHGTSCSSTWKKLHSFHEYWLIRNEFVLLFCLERSR